MPAPAPSSRGPSRRSRACRGGQSWRRRCGLPVAPGAGGAPGGGSLSPEGTSGAGTAAGSGGLGSESPSLEAALSDGANQNLFFIKMQERINAESRDYSAWSNILKARHDTVKNAIGNIR